MHACMHARVHTNTYTCTLAGPQNAASGAIGTGCAATRTRRHVDKHMIHALIVHTSMRTCSTHQARARVRAQMHALTSFLAL